MGESDTRIDMLVDTGASCNLMSVNLCRKLGMPIEQKEQVLVGFCGDTSRAIGTTQVMTRLGNGVSS